jgi:predicted anti-sigma-YlaC factor YlaD
MNCNWYQEQISMLIDRELDDEHATDVFHHLGRCADCRAFLQGTQRIQVHMAHIPLPPVPLSLDARVRTIPLKQGWRAALLSFQTGVSWWKRRLAIPVPAFGALMLMLLASLAVMIGLLGKPQVQAEPAPTTYIMSLSPIEVHPLSPESSSRIQ